MEIQKSNYIQKKKNFFNPTTNIYILIEKKPFSKYRSKKKEFLCARFLSFEKQKTAHINIIQINNNLTFYEKFSFHIPVIIITNIQKLLNDLNIIKV